MKGCTSNIKGLTTKEKLNIIPLVSYDVLIRMDWMESHKAIINCLNKTFTCVDDEGNDIMVKGIP